MGWTEEHVEAARSATPGTSHVTHLNNAGCSLPTQRTLDAVIGYLHNEANYGGYETFDASTTDLERPYTALASLLNCHPDEISVVTSATEAWQQVIYGLAAATTAEKNKWRPGDRLLTSLCEYGSNYIAYLQLQKRTGIQIEIIPETEEGDLDLVSLREMLQEQQQEQSSSSFPSPSKVVLVSINHVPTSSGRVYNVHGVGALTKEFSIPFLLDACQSVGQVPVDVKAIGCHFLTGTGRKYVRAPRGSGFLYCSKEAMSFFEPATLDNTGAVWSSSDTYELRPTAKRFERYEMSFAAKVGLGIAVEQCVELGIDTIWARIQSLAELLRVQLLQIDKNRVQIHDKGAVLCGIVSFTIKGIPADALQQKLFKEYGINTSVSRVPSSRLDFENRDLVAVVRASLHYYNTKEEVEKLVDAVTKLAM
ncbi:putative cysteine desulfurase [Nannochloris sp. 'desiccata']|nr:putative cysteine desulfurase [Chlorella desiccata (nom. nud.)]